MIFRWLLSIGAALGLSVMLGAAHAARFQAQSSTTVSGVVVDAVGPVAGATVRVRATDTSTTTDAAGHFTLTNLSPGEAVELTCAGYLPHPGENCSSSP
jgi:hypothetical protein